MLSGKVKAIHFSSFFLTVTNQKHFSASLVSSSNRHTHFTFFNFFFNKSSLGTSTPSSSIHQVNFKVINEIILLFFWNQFWWYFRENRGRYFHLLNSWILVQIVWILVPYELWMINCLSYGFRRWRWRIDSSSKLSLNCRKWRSEEKGVW